MSSSVAAANARRAPISAPSDPSGGAPEPAAAQPPVDRLGGTLRGAGQGLKVGGATALIVGVTTTTMYAASMGVPFHLLATEHTGAFVFLSTLYSSAVACVSVPAGVAGGAIRGALRGR